MSEHSHLPADLGHDGQFALERRGYSRMQVDESIAQLRLEMRGLQDGRHDLEDRLSQALDELERLKLELSAARSNGRPPHEEISERIGQILKLADDEAKSQRSKADEEIAQLRAEAQAETTKLRADAKAETDRSRADAQEQAERMLSAAQEQAETTVATAKAEAESTVGTAKAEAENTRKSAATEAQHVISDATRQAETAVATAKSQAKQQLDEATARATAIHDGAERRLNLLTSRHTETVRRLTEIRDVVTTLVAGETDRGSLEDEVARIVAGAVNGESQPGRPAGNGRPGAAEGGRHAGATGQQDGPPSLSTAQRPGMAGAGSAGRTAPAPTGSGGSQHDLRTQPAPASPAAQPGLGPNSDPAGLAARPAVPVSPAGAVGAPARQAGAAWSGGPVPPATPAQAGTSGPASRSTVSRVPPEADDTATGVKID
jgi:cell division septum initiation protein DivIVA